MLICIKQTRLGLLNAHHLSLVSLYFILKCIRLSLSVDSWKLLFLSVIFIARMKLQSHHVRVSSIKTSEKIYIKIKSFLKYHHHSLHHHNFQTYNIYFCGGCYYKWVQTSFESADVQVEVATCTYACADEAFTCLFPVMTTWWMELDARRACRRKCPAVVVHRRTDLYLSSTPDTVNTPGHFIVRHFPCTVN